MPKPRKILTINLIGKPDINLVTEHMLFPLNTRFIREDGIAFRYIVDKEGYKWIGEELWLERQGGKANERQEAGSSPGKESRHRQ